MTFDQYVDTLCGEHRHHPEVKEFIEYAKYRYRYPFTSQEEAEFIVAISDPTYSRSGIKKLYRELAAERRQRMVEFFQMGEQELTELMEKHGVG